MKRFFSSLIILSFIAAAIYYQYNTNPEFNQFITQIITTEPETKNIDSASTPEPQQLIKSKKSGTNNNDRTKINRDKYYKIDEHAKNTPAQYEQDIPTLAVYLTTPATTELEKVRALFTWVAVNISYDAVAFNSGNYADYSAENVLLTRKAVCEGYSNILNALCNAVDIESEKVVGYAKGYGYKNGATFSETDHAWNAIKINNIWKLFDATWASGFGTNKNGVMVTTDRYDPFWFDVHPKAFIFSHLPSESSWQLITNAITMNTYTTLPQLDPTLFKEGFDPARIFDDVISGKVNQFAEIYAVDFLVNISKLPYTFNLSREKEIRFEVESADAAEIVLIDDDIWHKFLRSNNTFILNYKPKGKMIKVCAKQKKEDKSYSTIIEYQVTDQTI